MITVENLSKSFSTNGNPVMALRDVSIDIDAGSLFGVVGPTGSGKSTLARCIGLQERPDRGRRLPPLAAPGAPLCAA